MRVKPLAVLDFDGTIARITAYPERAKVGLAEKRMLSRLVEIAETVILTGRPSSFVRKRLDPGKIKIVGLHGNEGRGKPAMLKRLEEKAEKEIRSVKGAFVEKKPCGFAIHYRRTAKKDAKKLSLALKKIFSLAGGKTKIVDGRKAVEFLPENALTKTGVLESMVRENQRRKVVFVGDDTEDCKAISTLKRFKNFRGALIKSREVYCNKGVERIPRGKLAVFLETSLSA